MSARSPQPASSFYSYSAKRSLSQEEIAAYRRIALATVTIVTLLVGGYFLGIPFLAQIGSSSTPIVTHNPLGTSDNIPPTAPRLDNLPDSSRTRTLTISGSAESGSTVSVMVNGREQIATVTDKNGLFSGQISLTSGDNSISATAKDSVGNLSRTSRAISITYDAAPPKVLIISPDQDPSTVNTASVTVQGKTDASATVVVNSHQVIVESDGTFRSLVSLVIGSNILTITVSDSAGNTSTVTKTVVYTSSTQSSSSATTQ